MLLGNYGGCGEVWGVSFATKAELFWTGGGEFNIYRSSLVANGQPEPWNCIASGLTAMPHLESSSPASGETWAYVVTKVDIGVEGPLGWGGSGCTERINTAPCSP